MQLNIRAIVCVVSALVENTHFIVNLNGCATVATIAVVVLMTTNEIY